MLQVINKSFNILDVKFHCHVTILQVKLLNCFGNMINGIH